SGRRASWSAFLERGYFWLIKALTCAAFVVSGTLSLPSWIRVCAAWISFQTLAEMELVFRSEMPPFARVRLYPCVPYVPLSMSASAFLKASVKFHSTEERSTWCLSIGPMFPMSPMNHTLCPALAVSIPCRYPNEALSPIPKMTSAPVAITCVTTRLPPAESSYPAELMVTNEILMFLLIFLTPATKPPLILYQLVSEAEMTTPTCLVLVVRAARMPARYEPC